MERVLVEDYIADRHLAWEPVAHQPSGTCLEAAQLAHIPPDRVAKAVVLMGHSGYSRPACEAKEKDRTWPT